MTPKETRSRAVRIAVAVTMPLLAGGCMVGPDYQPPGKHVPAAWAGASPAATSQPATAATSQPAPAAATSQPAGATSRPSSAATQPAGLATWWETFGDAKLTVLVAEALQVNLDLQLARARLRQARAQRGVVVGPLLPSITGTGSYERTHGSGAGATGAGTTGTGTGTGAATGAGATRSFYQAGVDASWEIDVFGGLRRNVESADALILSAQESIRDAQVTLAGEVALNYIALRGFQQQIVIARRNLKSQKHTAGITRQRMTAGFVSGLDVANAEAQVASTESVIPAFEGSAQQAIYALSVLLARPPADLLEELSPTGDLPAGGARIPLGLPSELLRRRPDIRQAEAQIHSATAQIGVATADLFPKFTLNGSYGWQTARGRNFLRDVSRSWAFGPSVDWAIFQGGAIVSNIQVQQALRDQAFIAYEQVVLTALQDVENALVALTQEQKRRMALADAVVYNRKAMELSMELYTKGQTDFLNVLNAERSLFASEDALVQSDRSIAIDLIALYKALGGGWENQPLVGKPPEGEKNR